MAVFPDMNIAYLPNTGKIGHLTKDQEEGLELFTQQVKEQSFYKESRHTPNYLLRFLRARKFNLNDSFKMLKDCEDWRQKEKVDDLVNSFQLPNKNEIHKVYPRFYHKCDKLGMPVYVELLGKMDINKVCDILAKDEPDKTKKQEKALKLMLNHFIVGYEHLENVIFPKCSKAAGAHIEQCVNILDLKDAGLSQASSVMPFVKQTANIAQNYYPEMMYKMYIINAPFLFRGAWSIVKGFLDPVTTSKISILGAGYQPELLKQIDAKNLPKMFGGECECDEGCDNSNAGPWNQDTNE